jgi:hypothetical protein
MIQFEVRIQPAIHQQSAGFKMVRRILGSILASENRFPDDAAFLGDANKFLSAGHPDALQLQQALGRSDEILVSVVLLPEGNLKLFLRIEEWCWVEFIIESASGQVTGVKSRFPS